MTRMISLALASVIFLGMATIATSSSAQERPARATISAQTASETPARATPPRRAQTDRLSPELQRALESGDMTQIAAHLPGRRAIARATTGSGDQMNIAIDPQAHTCNGGNCACAGVEDCVAMVDDQICKPDTIGCNANGCACEEADPPSSNQD